MWRITFLDFFFLFLTRFFGIALTNTDSHHVRFIKRKIVIYRNSKLLVKVSIPPQFVAEVSFRWLRRYCSKCITGHNPKKEAEDRVVVLFFLKLRLLTVLTHSDFVNLNLNTNLFCFFFKLNVVVSLVWVKIKIF